MNKSMLFVILMLICSFILFAQDAITISSNGNVGIGIGTPTETLEVDGNIKAAQVFAATNVPIGAIIAWYNTDEAISRGLPPLPDNFVSCDGQTINDPESIFNSMIVPALNNYARYLRGGNFPDIGETQEYATGLPTETPFSIGASGGHSHSLGTLSSYIGAPSKNENYSHYSQKGGWGYASYMSTSTAPNHTHTINVGDSETRPVSMIITWIMRIK